MLVLINSMENNSLESQFIYNLTWRLININKLLKLLRDRKIFSLMINHKMLLRRKRIVKYKKNDNC